jgi:hypothetical protein
MTRPNIASTNLNAATRFTWLRVGMITRVDYETLVADVEMIDASGLRTEIPLTQAMCGPRAFLGGIPEKGSIVIIGWRRYNETNGIPLILGYLPKGYLSQLNYDPTCLLDPATAPTSQYPDLLGISRLKYRKVYPGNILASSSEGADIVLNRNVRLYSASGDHFILGSDHTARLLTLNREDTLGSGIHWSGLIVRNKLLYVPDIFVEGTRQVPTTSPARAVLDGWGYLDLGGNLLPELDIDTVFPRTVTQDGRQFYAVPSTTDYNSSYDTHIYTYTEDRVEVCHTSDGVLKVTESSDGAEVNQDFPMIERVYGTYVGNSVFSDSDRALYGKVLRPVLFGCNDAAPGEVVPSFQECNRDNDDEDARIAAAYTYRLHRPDNLGEVMICHDKQGHGFYHFPATSASHPLGAGKSLSLNTLGNVKALLGRDGPGVSLDLATSGSVNLQFGKDPQGVSKNERHLGYSATQIIGKDNDGISYRFSNYETSSGGKVSNTFGNFIDAVSGTKDERYNKLSHKVIGDSSVFVGGEDNCTVKGKRFASYGDGFEESINKGDYLRKNTLGKHSVELTAGDAIITVKAGNIKNEVITGNHETKVTTGNYSVAVTSGNISLESKAGNIDIKTLGGQITIDSKTQVTLKAAVKIVLDAVMVDIGKVLAGGVVCGAGPANPAGHLDYMTGSPIMGSPTVKV